MQTGDFATKCEMADDTAFASGFDRFHTCCPAYNGLEKYDSMDCATKPPGSKFRDSSRSSEQGSQRIHGFLCFPPNRKAAQIPNRLK